MIYSSLYRVLGGRKIPPFNHIVEDIKEHLPKDAEERKAVLRELSFLTPRKCQPMLVTFTVMVYGALFLKRYKNINVDGVENVKKKGSQIFLSSHRSYVDSAYIQINLLKRNYEAPLILVGDNLSLFPHGFLFCTER